MSQTRSASSIALLGRALAVVVGAASFTLAFFLVLPLIQAIGKPVRADLELTEVDAANLPPPPPPPPEEEEPEEEEPEEEPPELVEETQPLDLSQLELALDLGFSEGVLGGDFAMKLQSFNEASSEDVDALFSLSDLDQRPRCVHQPQPSLSGLSAAARKRAPGTVYVLFIVNERGRVEDAKIQRSFDPAFEKPALSAVRRWKFEPGKRGGKAVRSRMRVPITFPKG